MKYEAQWGNHTTTSAGSVVKNYCGSITMVAVPWHKRLLRWLGRRSRELARGS